MHRHVCVCMYEWCEYAYVRVRVPVFVFLSGTHFFGLVCLPAATLVVIVVIAAVGSCVAFSSFFFLSIFKVSRQNTAAHNIENIKHLRQARDKPSSRTEQNGREWNSLAEPRLIQQFPYISTKVVC